MPQNGAQTSYDLDGECCLQSSYGKIETVAKDQKFWSEAPAALLHSFATTWLAPPTSMICLLLCQIGRLSECKRCHTDRTSGLAKSTKPPNLTFIQYATRSKLGNEVEMYGYGLDTVVCFVSDAPA